MKTLFISPLDESIMTGGTACSKRNLKSLQVLYGEENVITYILKSGKPINGIRGNIIKILSRIYSIFLLYMLGLNNNKTHEIYRLIECQHIDMLFLDSSLLGVLARKVKKRFPNVKIVTFFHNVEYHFAKDYIKVTKDYKRIIWIYLSYINERYACKYSDLNFALNTRDASIIEKINKCHIDEIIPISFLDTYQFDHKVQDKPALPVTIGFIGSYFYANVEGVKWFVENVFSHLDNVKFIIAGMGMGEIKKELPDNENIEILNNVPDLKDIYEAVDVLVMPIFSGSGMKVKTAEALMYGKYILGTSEAFEGYDITDQCGIICETSENFVTAIKTIKVSRFNVYSRLLFKSKYSFESTLKLFEKHLT